MKLSTAMRHVADLWPEFANQIGGAPSEKIRALEALVRWQVGVPAGLLPPDAHGWLEDPSAPSDAIFSKSRREPGEEKKLNMIYPV